MKKINRRDFLKLGACSIPFLGMPLLFPGCKTASQPEQEQQEVPTQREIVDLPKTAQAAAVLGSNLYTMTHDVIDALGGMGKIVNQGESVFIKPNFVSFPWAQTSPCFTNGECTKPEILIATAEACLQAGASEVIIGDGSQMYTFDWSHSWTLDRSVNLVQEAQRLSSEYPGNVTLACLETDSPAWDEIPSQTSLGTIAVSSMVTRADRVISIPVAKTHCWAHLTLAMKNFVGVTSLERYGVWLSPGHWDRGGGLDHSSPQAIAQIYLDVVAAVKPDLTIVDFSYGVEGDGPTLGSGGRTVDVSQRLGSWLVLASTDIVAADATAAWIMNHDTEKITQLTMAYDMGLGERRQGAIEMLGENLDKLVMPWQPAKLRNG
jgi:uncharacterized protein (DUF362 family)